MNEPIFNLPNLLYWLILGLIIYGEAVIFGTLWARREAARWTLGYFTVFALGIPLVAAGYWDANTWVGLFFGVGLSGAVKVGWEQIRKSQTAREMRAAPIFSAKWWIFLPRLWQGKGPVDNGPTDWER